MPTPPKDPDDQLPLEFPDDDSANPANESPEGTLAETTVEGEGTDAAPAEIHHAFVPTAARGQTPRRLGHVGEMYGNWFMDYASYVILERAVPHINDGLKPVQRRILHSMKIMDDGRFDKVANIAGQATQYHPHGESAIVDAIVGLGQKQLLIETQGNWGNIFTGDNAAASRYIEARISKFGNEILFNPKITEWQLSYDGRKKEPVTLPVKFPLLLAQGVEGIAVGLACKILPHNFIELIDGAIDCLKGKKPVLLPDFPTSGLMDATEYNDGARGGKVRVRARIEDTKKKNILRITEIPFGITTNSLVDSILAANDKGKLKIARIEDLTAESVEILVHLPPGTEAADMLNALYVFTNCEVSISVNACVIEQEKPIFTNVSYLLKYAADHTRDILKRELEITLSELDEKWHFSSLEKIFIEKRIYRDIEECATWEGVMIAIWKGLKPYLKLLRREVTDDDVTRLTEIRIKRISKFNSFEADEYLRGLETQIAETKNHLENLTKYAIAYFRDLKSKYGKGRERKTEITSFARVAASEAAVATETLNVDWKEGFIGYGMKRTGEPLCKCSRLDDIIVFLEDGSMKVSKVSEKAFFGVPQHVAIFNKDKNWVYTMAYKDGRQGRVYVKRFQVGGVTRDTVYDLTKGTKGSKVLYFSVHETEEESAAQSLTVHLNPAPRLKNTEIIINMSDVATKGRAAIGITVTDHTVKRVSKTRAE